MNEPREMATAQTRAPGKGVGSHQPPPIGIRASVAKISGCRIQWFGEGGKGTFALMVWAAVAAGQSLSR
jgi:hypothetical protein